MCVGVCVCKYCTQKNPLFGTAFGTEKAILDKIPCTYGGIPIFIHVYTHVDTCIDQNENTL